MDKGKTKTKTIKKEGLFMKLAKRWHRRLFAATLGMAIVGAPLFAVHAEDQPAFTRDGQQYDVRRGMYEKDGGSDEHIPLGRYADEKHREERAEERREDQEKHEAEERREEAQAEAERKEHSEKTEAHHEKREYKYDVRRGMYEKEGGSDTQVAPGMYEQPSADGEQHTLTR